MAVRDSVPAGSHRGTRGLLACGAAAGPVYIVVGTVEAFARPIAVMVILAFTAAVVLAWSWITAASGRLAADLAEGR